MSESGRPVWSDEELMVAWEGLSRNAGPTDDCPPAGTIWEAATGELDAAGRRAIVDHIAECPACAEAWRLAVAMERAGAQGAPAMEAPERSIRLGTTTVWRRYGLAAAAVLVAGVIAFTLFPGDADETTTYRGVGVGEIQSLVEGRPQSPGDCLLRWEGGPAEASVRLSLFDEDGELVWDIEGSGLAGAVPHPGLLETLPTGSKLTWQVVATPQDGSEEIVSDLFTFELRRP